MKGAMKAAEINKLARQTCRGIEMERGRKFTAKSRQSCLKREVREIRREIKQYTR